MNLAKLFAEIRSVYFPRWDRRLEWIATFSADDERHNNTGYCDSVDKTIYLDERQILLMSEAGVTAFLIHEICHDVGAAFHNRRWAKRMELAATRADMLGESEVARIVRSEVFSYAGNGVRDDYGLHNVRDFAEELIALNPSMDHAAAIKRIAKYFGYTPSKVKRDFSDVIKGAITGHTEL